ncbi:kinase-like domain-containing protein [Lophiotrema nucula]|uniref:Kinase-like domain-containing protein n=1 Tax=Lophiotrema nucula TaxID=690887 RepID=A0A6A5Z7W5_9PLEO|nr:kinase-like domain-containing protein [Lophiotrema nucula]
MSSITSNFPAFAQGNDMPQSTHAKQPAAGRQDFETIQAIPDEAFIQLFLKKMEPAESHKEACQVKMRISGSYHLCVFIEAADMSTFVIKVPAAGTPALWQSEEDGANLRSEVGTMNLIRKTTSIPVPEVFAFNETLLNPIGAPYILMEAMSGQCAMSLWFGVTENNVITQQNIDSASPELEAKRMNFLKSLASYMAELTKFSFDAIGMLNFDIDPEDPFVDDWYVWNDEEGGMVGNSPWNISQDFISSVLVGNALNCPPEMLETPMIKGLTNFLAWLFQCVPLVESMAKGDEEESFVLMHNDLHLRNILVDEDGNVTGIIDWDASLTVPRTIGPASLPIFLEEDWWREGLCLHSTQKLDFYRRVYAQYMIAATGRKGDGVYTFKSCIYSAAIRTPNSFEDAIFFVEKFIQSSALLREHYDVETLLCEAGRWTGDINEPIYTLLRETVMPEVLAPLVPPKILKTVGAARKRVSE